MPAQEKTTRRSRRRAILTRGAWLAATLVITGPAGAASATGGPASGGPASGGPAYAGKHPPAGRYEVTTTTTYTDVPVPDTTVTTEHCLTAEDLTKNPAAVFAGLPEGRSCDIGHFSMAGGEIDLDLSCAAPDGNLRMLTQGDYDAAGYRMESEVTITVGQSSVRMQSVTRGRRLGDC